MKGKLDEELGLRFALRIKLRETLFFLDRNEDRPEGEVDLTSRRLSQRERGDHLFNSPGNTRNPASQNRPRVLMR